MYSVLSVWTLEEPEWSFLVATLVYEFGYHRQTLPWVCCLKSGKDLLRQRRRPGMHSSSLWLLDLEVF